MTELLGEPASGAPRAPPLVAAGVSGE